MTVVPRGFPQSPSLKRVVDKGEVLAVRGQAMQILKANWRAIVYDVCAGLAAHDIAVKYQVSERSLWNFLKKLDITMTDITKMCKEEEELKRMTRLEKIRKKQERMKILPTDFDEFRQLELIQELEKQLRLKDDTESNIKRNVKAIYELCLFTGKHPEDITIDDVLNFMDYKRLEWQERGKDLRAQHVLAQFSTQYISPLRVFAAFRGLPIPPALSTTEYYSPYHKVRITVEYRYKILKWVKENYPEDYDTVRAVLIYLYETGSRASALSSVQFLETEEFGTRVIYAITEEKGKKARIRWEKPLNPKWYQYIKSKLPLSNKEVERVRKILRKAYEAVLPEGLTRKYALEHGFHVWRHTAANDLLEASGYNLMLVAQKLGWKNVQMIVNVYGTMDRAMLLKLSGYNVNYEAAKFEFLYNHWEERAREEGLI
ncbi:MAG TPA: hypothetical protein EYP33_05615 [Pyrodictium sp.]|nr:hypothetical protein [Pyrodictium sp.]